MGPKHLFSATTAPRVLGFSPPVSVPVPVPGRWKIAFHGMARVVHGEVHGSAPIGQSGVGEDRCDPSDPIGHPPRQLPLSGTGTGTGASAIRDEP